MWTVLFFILNKISKNIKNTHVDMAWLYSEGAVCLEAETKRESQSWDQKMVKFESRQKPTEGWVQIKTWFFYVW